MTFHQQLQRRALLSLQAMDGRPMPDDALVDAVRLNVAPRPTLADAEAAVRRLESLRLISGVTDDITGVTWTLTTAGLHKARSIE
jgi:hypothetical protein